MSVRRQPMPDTASHIAIVKNDYGNKRAVVPVMGTGAEVVVKSKGLGRIVVRRVGRGGPRMTHPKAVALAACKGKRGDVFKGCVKTALGNAPSTFGSQYHTKK